MRLEAGVLRGHGDLADERFADNEERGDGGHVEEAEREGTYEQRERHITASYETAYEQWKRRITASGHVGKAERAGSYTLKKQSMKVPTR